MGVETMRGSDALWEPMLRSLRDGDTSMELGIPVLAMTEARELRKDAPMASPRDGLERIRERLERLQTRVRSNEAPFVLLVDATMLAAAAMQFATTFGSPGGRMTVDDVVVPE
jgi:hypothetical protein